MPAPRSVVGCSMWDAPRKRSQPLENAKPRQRSRRQYDDDDLFYMLADGGGFDVEWEDVYLKALDAMGHKDQAQQLRWQAFEERLAAPRLRAYLKKLPDFEDVVAEDKAKAYALEFNNFVVALHFLIEWPDPANAAHLVLQRHREIDGNAYWLLDPAARRLEGKQPLAASLLRRAMIEDTLNGAKSKRYKHAARHLAECRALAGVIEDYDPFGNHDVFVKSLRAVHGRKHGFWSKVAEDVEPLTRKLQLRCEALLVSPGDRKQDLPSMVGRLSGIGREALLLSRPAWASTKPWTGMRHCAEKRPKGY